MNNVNQKLKGQYRVRIFNQDDQLLSDTDYQDNIITNSGHLFPFDVAFADCFRYLSLGSGTAANVVSMTGVEKAIPEFEYLGVYKAVETFGTDVLGGRYPADWYYSPEGCGHTLNTGSVELFRTWRVPTGEGFATKNYDGASQIKELVVSPSAPIEIGMANPTSGKGNYLPFVPSANQVLAFSRLTGNFTLPIGDYALISYKLTVYPSIGPTLYAKQFVTSNFNPATINGSAPCTGWTGTISGVYGLIHPGIKLISSVDGPPNGYQAPELVENPDYPPSDGGPNKFGISYTPQVGIPLEPSNTSYVGYLSDDNTQFFVNSNGGKIPPAQTGSYYPFNPVGIRSSGVCSYRFELPHSGNSNAVINIRKRGNYSEFPYTGDITNDQTISVSTVLGTVSLSSHIDTVVPANSTRTISLGWQSSFGNRLVSSLVLGCEDVNSPTVFHYPFLDMIFNTTSGSIFPATGRVGDVVSFVPTPPEAKLYLDGIHNLGLSFNLKWSGV